MSNKEFKIKPLESYSFAEKIEFFNMMHENVGHYITKCVDTFKDDSFLDVENEQHGLFESAVMGIDKDFFEFFNENV